MPKTKPIDLSDVPKLDKLILITNKGQLNSFLGELRQDWYSSDQLEKYNLASKLENWIRSRGQNTITFFAVHDEKDQQKNDGWGHYALLRGIAVRSPNGEIHIFKSLVQKFWH